MKPTTYVGMDVHRKSIVIAILRPDGTKPVEMQVPNDATGVRKLIQAFRREGEVICCYEAGPCGFVLKRKLDAAGIRCVVIAPSLIPGRPGDRIKTDRRDARKLAELLRAGLLTEVHLPTPDEEAVRDLTRCLEDAKQDLTRARHRLTKLLLRRGHSFTEGHAWTAAHRRWLKNLSLELQGPVQITFDNYLLTIEQTEERARALEKKVAAIAQTEPYREAVGWLRCFRGIDTFSAMILLTEIHGFERFVSPRQLAA
jgi:transposase